MEFEFRDRKITMDKELNSLDEMALDFSAVLAGAGIGHVFLSGYVAILFGRNRTSEDIDVICRKCDHDTFLVVWKDIHRVMECIITSDPEEAYDEYLLNETAVRFARKGKFVPNVEMSFAHTDLQQKALDDKLVVVLNGMELPISPLEQQIAYKTFMASDKDLEDARFLFRVFDQHLDMDLLARNLETLEVNIDSARDILGWS